MEIVDQEVEKLLPTFRAAIHCELLDEEEVKDIVRKRKKAEGRLIKREAEIRDFIDFVYMDTMIIKLITKRRLKSQYKEKLAEIEYPLVERLNRLLKRAHRLWPQDMNLWQTHISLLEKWNKRTQLSKLYEELVAMHPNNVDAWLQSARFQVERNGSIDQARKILLRAEMQLPKEPLVWNQLFRVELLNAAQLRKRLEVLGGKIADDVENDVEKDLSMGAAAFKIAQLAKKKIPDNPALIYEMLHSAKSMKDPIEPLVKKLVVLLMEFETADATVCQAKYMVNFTAGGVEAARKLYKENTEKFPGSLLLKYHFAVFLNENRVDGLDECIGRIKEALKSDSLIEKDLRRGALVNFLRKQGSHKLAEEFQLKICSENATDDHERLLLADIQCDLELTSAQETLEKVFKADSKKILASCVEIALRWAGEDESRLYWLSSKCAEGKCRFLKIKEEQNSTTVGKLAFQLSTTAPVSAEFMREGLRLLENTDLNKFTFAEKCCSMKNDAECWVEFLRLTKSEKLENLGIVMSKARANLSGPELEKLHQIWTQ